MKHFTYHIWAENAPVNKVLSKGRSDNGGLDAEIQVKKKTLEWW